MMIVWCNGVYYHHDMNMVYVGMWGIYGYGVYYG